MNKTDNTLDILNVMIARLCHDMSSPIGSINLGVEVLNPENFDEITPLINMGYQKAVNTIDVFRALCTEDMSLEQTLKILSAFAKNKDIALNHSLDNTPKKVLKVVYLMSLILINCTNKNGHIQLNLLNENQISIMTDSGNISSAEIQKLLNKDDAMSSKNAIASYLLIYLNQNAIDILVNKDEPSKIEIIISH